jgi:hypothetical protein
MTDSEVTRKSIAADVYLRGLALTMTMRGRCYDEQSIADVFGDMFTSWLASPRPPYSNRCRWTAKHRPNLRAIAITNASWVARHALAVIDGSPKWGRQARRSKSIATPITSVCEQAEPVLSTWY